MMNEAYTWVITTSVAANAVGAAVAGVVVDRAGTGWALATAGLVVAGSAALVAYPRGPLARADTQPAPVLRRMR
ncbi:MAG TPA: MFS transporter, partial [Rugosimonospora sp.]|nr:MFS transporter [Rugosimonospora sp.]